MSSIGEVELLQRQCADAYAKWMAFNDPIFRHALQAKPPVTDKIITRFNHWCQLHGAPDYVSKAFQKRLQNDLLDGSLLRDYCC